MDVVITNIHLTTLSHSELAYVVILYYNHDYDISFRISLCCDYLL